MRLLSPAVMCAVLAWVAVEDARKFRIRNGAVLLSVLAFLSDCLLNGRVGAVVPHAIFAFLALLALIGAFLLRMMGGGDAKLLAAALLWVGPEGCTLFSVALFASTIGYALGAWGGWLPSRGVGQRTAIPFGASIAAAWLVSLGVTAWFEHGP